MEIALQIGLNFTTVVHSSYWHLKKNWNIGIPISMYLLVSNSVPCVKIWCNSVQ